MFKYPTLDPPNPQEYVNECEQLLGPRQGESGLIFCNRNQGKKSLLQLPTLNVYMGPYNQRAKEIIMGWLDFTCPEIVEARRGVQYFERIADNPEESCMVNFFKMKEQLVFGKALQEISEIRRGIENVVIGVNGNTGFVGNEEVGFREIEKGLIELQNAENRLDLFKKNYRDECHGILDRIRAANREREAQRVVEGLSNLDLDKKTE